jgi:hypothetical protein
LSALAESRLAAKSRAEPRMERRIIGFGIY